MNFQFTTQEVDVLNGRARAISERQLGTLCKAPTLTNIDCVCFRVSPSVPLLLHHQIILLPLRRPPSLFPLPLLAVPLLLRLHQLYIQEHGKQC